MPITPFAIIPTRVSEWTPAVIKDLKAAGFAALNDNVMQLWPTAEDYRDSTVPPKAIPLDGARQCQPYNMRPSVVPQGIPLCFAVEKNGKPVAENFTPDTTGGNVGRNPPETFKQPGTGTPTLTMEVLGGGSFALFMAEYGGHFKNGIAKFIWASADGLYAPNFSTARELRPLPIAYNVPGLGAYPYTWPRDVIPYITDEGQIGVVKVEEVKKLGKFGQTQPTTPATIVYRNTGAQTAAVIASLQNAGFSGDVLGDAVNRAARMTI
jgi:hypothetical protein